jgi:hypothetical protein
MQREVIYSISWINFSKYDILSDVHIEDVEYYHRTNLKEVRGYKCRAQDFFFIFSTAHSVSPIQFNKYELTARSALLPAADQIKGSLIHPLEGFCSGSRVIPYLSRLNQCSRR